MRRFVRLCVTMTAAIGLSAMSASALAQSHQSTSHHQSAVTDLPDLPMAPAPINVDPYEKFNRAMFSVNKVFLGLFIEPAEYIYTNGIWSPVQNRVSDFYSNVKEINTIPNDLLQGKVSYFFNDTWRFLINSTLGLGGLFDVAKHMGLPPHHTDFGQTLSVWGGQQSAYLMLPILGPGTFRDDFALPFDTVMSPYPYIKPTGDAWALYAGKELNRQASLFPVYQEMRSAFDPYVFARNAYMQHRHAEIAQNNVPYDVYVADYYAKPLNANTADQAPKTQRVSKNHTVADNTGKLGKLGNIH